MSQPGRSNAITLISNSELRCIQVFKNKCYTVNSLLDIHPEVQAALANKRPVVALESTLIAHGLPRSDNLACALNLEHTIRQAEVVPATIGISNGRIKIGLDSDELERFASTDNIAKISRRDLAAVLAREGDGATTVATTMICATLAGIPILATGGIGGVHRGAETSLDISADLYELGRTPVAVVCAGAKSILDLPKTLEMLESLGVPVLGFGSDEFPAFYARSSKLRVDTQVESAAEAADILALHRRLGLKNGVVITVPIPESHAIPQSQLEHWMTQALSAAKIAGISGKNITPYLLSQLAVLSGSRTVRANKALLSHNAMIAAEIAMALSKLESTQD